MYTTILVLSLNSLAAMPGQIDGYCCPPAVVLQPPVCCDARLTLKPVNDGRLPADPIIYWNETVLNAIRADRTSPPQAARNLAIVHAAIYDAVNAIQRTHARFYVRTEAAPGTSAEAAAAVAAHRTLVALYPQQIARLDAALDEALQVIPDGPGKSAGIRLGQQVAETVLAWRGRDGSTNQVAYTAKAGAGWWQPTPPDFRAALLPHWPSVTCFCMRAGSQFRPAGPPALTSEAYAASYKEVKTLGGLNSQARTADQTDIAYFWSDDAGTATPPGHWNQVAQSAARSRGTSLAENARLFALLNLALADAAIVSWDCKYKFDFWRPIQGIRAAAIQADPAISGDPTWTPLLTTPPFPSYTSGHSTFSGAAAAVLANFFGNDEMRFTVASDGLPGRSRSFTSFSAAAAEAGRSRIYGGIHWEFDNAHGLATGRALGEYVSGSFLTAKPKELSGMRTPWLTLHPGRQRAPVVQD